MKLKNTETVSDCAIHQKIKYGNQRTAIWGLFSDYCKHSSIHGVQYLGEQKRSYPERLFWILIFAFSIYGCLSLIGNTWAKWQRNPVIVSFNEIPTPVSKIPFPAITICPEFKFLQDKYNFTNVVMKLFTNLTENSQLTEKERIYTDAMGHICEYDTLTEVFEKFNNNTQYIFEGENKFTNLSTIISTFEELNPYMDRIFSDCYFQSKLIPCKHFFKKIITKEGICFSFNQLDFEYMYRNETVIKENYLKKNGTLEWVSHIKKPNEELDWNIEHGYRKNSNKYSYPRRSLWSGTKAGLFLWLSGYKCKWDKFCRGPVLGYKILLSAPDEIDDVSSQYIQIPLGQQILVSMKPKVLYTSKQLINYKPKTRQCFFQNERYLRYFKYYNQKNCYFECLTNFTLVECGCVRFDMPMRNDTPVCGLGNLQCYNNAESNLINQELEVSFQQKDQNFKNFLKSTCNCLPACTSIAYETEITQAPYNVTNHYEAFISSFEKDYSDVTDMTRLFIFFKEQQFLTSKRSELYGLTEFLANCGGLLGLFMGVSTLSLVEFIYFCTIRLGVNLNRRRKAKNGNNKNIENNN